MIHHACICWKIFREKPTPKPRLSNWYKSSLYEYFVHYRQRRLWKFLAFFSLAIVFRRQLGLRLLAPTMFSIRSKRAKYPKCVKTGLVSFYIFQGNVSSCILNHEKISFASFFKFVFLAGYFLSSGHPGFVREVAIWIIWEESIISHFLRFILLTWVFLTCSWSFESLLNLFSS